MRCGWTSRKRIGRSSLRIRPAPPQHGDLVAFDVDFHRIGPERQLVAQTVEGAHGDGEHPRRVRRRGRLGGGFEVVPGVAHAEDARRSADRGLHRSDAGAGVAPHVGLQDLPGERRGLDGQGGVVGPALGEGEREEAVAGADVQQAVAAGALGEEAVELPDHLGRAEAEPFERLARLRIDGQAEPGPEHHLVRRGAGVQSAVKALEPEAARIDRLRAVPEGAQGLERSFRDDGGGGAPQESL